MVESEYRPPLVAQNSVQSRQSITKSSVSIEKDKKEKADNAGEKLITKETTKSGAVSFSNITELNKKL